MSDNDHVRSAVPRAVATGNAHYYLDRLADFRQRLPESRPPSYYADFGDKCLLQFLATKHTLSPRGQRWVEDTLELLQEMMEEERRRDDVGFSELERDDDAFTEFAFSTHSRAYLETGVFDLGARDLWKIVRTPDVSDVLSDVGVREILRLVFGFDSRPREGLRFDPNSTTAGVLGTLARSSRRLRSR